MNWLLSRFWPILHPEERVSTSCIGRTDRFWVPSKRPADMRRTHRKVRTGCSECRRRRIKVSIDPWTLLLVQITWTKSFSAMKGSRNAKVVRGTNYNVAWYFSTPMLHHSLPKPLSLSSRQESHHGVWGPHLLHPGASALLSWIGRVSSSFITTLPPYT